MKSVMFLLACALGFAGVAQAQTASESKGYIEAVAQSAFGSATSQSFGAEAGLSVMPGLQVFVEGGAVRDTATSALGDDARKISAYLSQAQSGVNYGLKRPVTFGLVGVRHPFVGMSRIEPYVLAGVGIARVAPDATFTIGQTNVTASLAQYGVVLGSDLSGTQTKAMLGLGAGATWPIHKRLIIDFQGRYGRVFASGQGINITRAGVGLGIKF